MSEADSRSARRSPPNASRSTRLLLLFALGLVALTWFAAKAAVSVVGTPFPSLMVDPFGSYSAVYLPSWTVAETEQGETAPKFPDRVVAVDGIDLNADESVHPSRTLTERVLRLSEEGRSTVVLTLDREGERYEVRRPLRRFGTDDAVFFFGLYAVVALLVLWSSVMVMVLAKRRPAAKAYAFWSIGAVLFLVTFFDYHTTLRFVPLFSLAVPWIAAGFVALGWYFPDPPVSFKRAQALLWLLGCCVAAAAVWIAAAPLQGHDPSLARRIAGYAAPAGGAVLVVALLLRARHADTKSRREVRAALWGMAVVPALAAVGLALPSVNGVGVIHLMAPFLVPLIPLSIGYALVRHNILATTALLTRRMLVVPVALIALFGAMVAWMLWRGTLGVLGPERGAPLAAAVATFMLLYALGHRFSTHLFFSATAGFRPSIEQLSDALSSRGDAALIREAIEGVVRRWLPTPAARVLSQDDLAAIKHLPPDAEAALTAGEFVWTEEDPWSRSLLVPVRSLGVLRGIIHLAPRDDRALFTSEDLALLKTIASLGAVALHKAEVVESLDALRKLEVGATREDKVRALGAVGAELSHELMGPLSFFRFLLNRAGAHQDLEPDDVATGQSEVERLERMLDNLRRFHTPPARLQHVAVSAVVQRAVRLVTTDSERRAGVAVQVDTSLDVRADPDGLLQVVLNLLKNALDAAGPNGTVIVRTWRDPTGAPQLEISDSGPGIPPHLEKSAFNPWVTTKPTGSGLGLAITQRIVRSFGWTICYRREQDRTCFIVTMIDEHPAL